MTAHDLDGRTALVTAGSRTLGADICRSLAAAGANVIVHYHTSDSAARELVAELGQSNPGRHHALPGDLSRPEGMTALASSALEAAGNVDILVNNAGPFSMTPFLDMTVEEWTQVWHANVTAIQQLARSLVPSMRAAGWGRVINISAGSAYLRNHTIYGLAKDAVRHLTEALSLEAGPAVTVNAIAPGQIHESAPDVTAIDPTFVERALERTPMGRLVHRSEVATVVTRLCSPDFDMLTGATIPLDGGWRLNRF